MTSRLPRPSGGQQCGRGAARTLVHTDTVEAFIGDYATPPSHGDQGAHQRPPTEELIGITAAGAPAVAAVTARRRSVFQRSPWRGARGHHHVDRRVATLRPVGWPTTITSPSAFPAARFHRRGRDVGKIDKFTAAYIDSGVTANVTGDIDVTANVTEDITSVAAGCQRGPA
jgi:hypothetical protein